MGQVLTIALENHEDVVAEFMKQNTLFGVTYFLLAHFVKHMYIHFHTF